MEIKPNKEIFITQPLLPSLDKLIVQLGDIWESKWVTNMGPKHILLENRLKELLKVKNLSLFNNGTTALLTAIKSLDLPAGSEVITTPFTFAATPHCISWNGLTPVFCDINPDTMCIDASKIESLITPKTSAILAVHVYGFPCDVAKIEEIAKKYSLKVVYDAAHSFLTEIDGVGIGTLGDITMFSFHATKLFNTIEGGCLTYNNQDLSKKIYNLRNFGIRSEELVENIGINGKLNELQSVIGLLNLDILDEEREKRSKIKEFYDLKISQIKGLRVPQLSFGVTNSYEYYPIVVENDYPISRDALYEKFQKLGIKPRKYFYPLCSDYACYKDLPSANISNLPVANDLKNKVLCLPFYGDLPQDARDKIAEVLNV